MSCQEEGLFHLSQTGLLYKDLIGYQDYEGLDLNLEEQKRLIKDFREKKQLIILRNNGLFTRGRTEPEAFIMMYYLEQACKIQIAARAGDKVRLPKPEVQDLVHQKAMKGFGTRLGEMEFKALKRRLVRNGSGHAT